MSCCAARAISPVQRRPHHEADPRRVHNGADGVADGASAQSSPGTSAGSVYDFVVKGPKGQPYDLKQHEGKPILCMNVASKCTYTKTGYEAATELFDKYKDQGFTVLAFPCNQFGGQEPGSEDEIKEFACTRFKADFPLMSKCDVNGEKAEPLWEYMKKQKPGIFGSLAVKWNFTSFLCDANGKPIKRYSPGTKAADIEKDLAPILTAQK